MACLSTADPFGLKLGGVVPVCTCAHQIPYSIYVCVYYALCVYVCVCMCMCVCVCMHACVCVCVCVCVCDMHICIYLPPPPPHLPPDDDVFYLFFQKQKIGAELHIKIHHIKIHL